MKVADERLEWRQVLCETNMSEAIISQLQRSLKSQGYDPGRIDGSIGRQTLEAVEQYQLKRGLERGGLTLATLRSPRCKNLEHGRNSQKR
jgi:peptidoglycan hydrolase-like protein with peptidoglycan-binding domain